MPDYLMVIFPAAKISGTPNNIAAPENNHSTSFRDYKPAGTYGYQNSGMIAIYPFSFLPQ